MGEPNLVEYNREQYRIRIRQLEARIEVVAGDYNALCDLIDGPEGGLGLGAGLGEYPGVVGECRFVAGEGDSPDPDSGQRGLYAKESACPLCFGIGGLHDQNCNIGRATLPVAEDTSDEQKPGSPRGRD